MPAGTAPAGAPAQARSPQWAWGPSLAILAPQLCVWAPLLPCLLGTLGSKPHLFRPLFFSHHNGHEKSNPMRRRGKLFQTLLKIAF